MTHRNQSYRNRITANARSAAEAAAASVCLAQECAGAAGTVSMRRYVVSSAYTCIMGGHSEALKAANAASVSDAAAYVSTAADNFILLVNGPHLSVRRCHAG